MTTNPLHTFTGEPRSLVPLSGNDTQLITAEQVRVLTSSPLTLTAVADDNGVPVPTTVTRKAGCGCGWYIKAGTKSEDTSKVVITLTGPDGAFSENGSQKNSWNSVWAPYFQFGILRIQHGSTREAVLRFQEFVVGGRECEIIAGETKNVACMINPNHGIFIPPPVSIQCEFRKIIITCPAFLYGEAGNVSVSYEAI